MCGALANMKYTNTYRSLAIAVCYLAIADANLALASLTIDVPSGMKGTSALEGNYAYIWTVASGPLAAGQTVNSASITFSNIKLTATGHGNDISFDLGRVFTGMSKPSAGSLPTAGHYGTYTDNDALGDAFGGNIPANARNLGTQSLTLNQLTSWTYNFSSADLTALNSYANQGSWGFLIDPDCTFNVGDICFSYTTVPEPSTFIAGALLAIPFCIRGARCWRNRRHAA